MTALGFELTTQRQKALIIIYRRNSTQVTGYYSVSHIQRVTLYSTNNSTWYILKDVVKERGAQK